MLTLLTPSALLALLGLLVPLAIHLWNRRPGREVAVGSLRWLAAGANRRLRNLKLEQLWLLLLRAAVLGALALALAGPAWRQTLPAGRGQVLLSSEVLGTPALATLRPLIDSLRRQGFGLRWLDSSFGRVPLVAWQPDSAGGPADSGKVVQAAAATIGRFSWARVQQAAGAFPGQPLHVFTTGTLRDFAGSHSPLASNIFWHAVPESEAKSWVQSATLFGDSLRLLLGLSTEAQTTFRRVAQVRPAVNDLVRLSGLAPLRYEKADDTFRLVAADTAGAGKPFSRPVPVRTRPIQAVIYTTAAYAPDARYLQAGLRAAAAGLPVPLSLTLTRTPPGAAAQPDWLFWLADAPLPAAWAAAARRGTQVWQVATGPGRADESRLAMGDGAELATVFRRTTPAALEAGATIVWADGLGRPVLSRRPAGRGAFYRLHTRLDPSWSSLADRPTLPTQLLALLQPEPAAEAVHAVSNRVQDAFDQRAIDPTQLVSLPVPTDTKSASDGPTASASPTFRFVNLQPWAVLLAGLLFALERLLAARQAPAVSLRSI